MRWLAVLVGIVFGTPSFGGDNDLGLPPEPPAADRLPGATSLSLVGQMRQPAVLKDIDAEQRFSFQTEMGPLSVVTDDLVRWGNPIEAKGGARVVLTGESELIAAHAWKVEEPIRLDETSCQITTLPFGKVSVDRSQIQAIYFASTEGRQEPYFKRSRPDPAAGGRDVILLANGDRLRGQVRAIGTDGVVVEVPSDKISIETEAIESVHFNSLLKSPPALPKRRLLLGLSDGSRLVIRPIATNPDATSKRSTKLASGATLPWPDIDDVVFIQPLGGKVRYVSEMTPVRYQHIPFLDLMWPYEIDRNVLRTQLQASDGSYAKGIGVHSASRLVYKLNGQYSRFAADIAMDTAAGKRGSVVFRVFVAIDGAWHELFKSPIVRGGDLPRPVSVDLEGARGLALVVDYADYGDERDLANWLDARLE